MSERFSPARGAATIQDSRRVLREQHGMWEQRNDNPALTQVVPTYRIARASLPVQDRRRCASQQQQEASRHHAGCLLYTSDAADE